MLGLYSLKADLTYSQNKTDNLRIAIIADAHVQDTSKLRTLDDQLHSTRLFNENYFAFIAALDDIVKRGIHHVVLPGDLTDDGQPINVTLVKNILKDYSQKQGITFLAMTGNHDPSRPFTEKEDQGDMRTWGYQEILNEWSDFGFFPKKEFLYWETPFSSYTYSDYCYEEAREEASLSKRTYRYTSDSGLTLNPVLPDASYLAEPIEGVWVLMIDASVYQPDKVKSDSILSFKSAGTGYKDVLTVRKHLLPWISKVVAQAERLGKTLIAFSHYPMTDYNSGAASYIPQIARAGRFDVQRFPIPQMTDLLADAGIKIHFGGHIHMNDDATHISAKGNKLRNVQVPSTGGYAPGYKILTIETGNQFSVETASLDEVRGFDSFFERYRQEHDALKLANKTPLWNDAILSAENYRAFCEKHLRELVRLRYLPNDLLPIAEEQVIKMNAKELFSYAGITPQGSPEWSGFDLIVDFYKLRMGGTSALADIDKTRINEYTQLMSNLMDKKAESDLDRFLSGFSHFFMARLQAVSHENK